MKRKKFIAKSIIGLGSIVSIPSIIAACSKDLENSSNDIIDDVVGDCELAPSETAGPFPIKSPADLVKENIISDRVGIPMVIDLIIQDQSNDCNPMEGVFVDLWHCDAEGNYSEYGGVRMQETDYTSVHFLRGRQTTNSEGKVSFVSIFPGWYPSRAPHIHLEILDSNENSIRVTQIAFSKEVCDIIYATNHYNGEADTLNARDNVFSDSLDGNMADSITGDIAEGYVVNKIIVV